MAVLIRYTFLKEMEMIPMALIDRVAENCGLFISDMKVSENSEIILHVLKEMAEDVYPPEDWNHFAEYLFNEPFHFKSSGEGRDFCLSRLKEVHLCG